MNYPELDYIYYFPIDLELNKILVESELIGKWQIFMVGREKNSKCYLDQNLQHCDRVW